MKREGIDVLMVTTVAAAVLYAFYSIMQIVVLKLPPPPPYHTPWVVSIFGMVMMIYLGYKLITLPGVDYWFAVTFAIFNLFTGSGLFLVVISELLGPGSRLYHYMH